VKSSDFTRSRRVADQMAREIAEMLLTEVADPRVRGVTVSGVELSPDMRNATVFVTCPEAAEVASVLQGLARASAFIRHRLGERLRMKYLPQIRFQHDTSLNQANRIEQLLRDGGN
jgi:ribosome-binding factor A